MFLTISICLLVIFVCLILIFSIFKSSMPKNFEEVKFEFRYIWHGIVSSVEDNSIGLCYNRVCKKVAWPHFNYKYSYKNIFVALYKQDSSIAVLTGGNRGLGLRVLKKLLECEMTVILGKVRHTLKIVTKNYCF